MIIEDLLHYEVLENPLSDYLYCTIILLLGLLLKKLGARFVSRQSFRIVKGFSKDRFSNEFVALLQKPIEQLLTFIILYFAFDRLRFPESWNLVAIDQVGLRWFIHTIWLIAMFVTGTKIILRATDFFTFVLTRREESPFSLELSNFLKELIKVVLVILAVFAGLRFIFHVNITALVASLGIGGLAVALAAQDTLANLLGSFIIYLDKPFKVGDNIEAGEIKGTVEHVGFRTTRIRTENKSLLSVPNKRIADALLTNITQSKMRRVALTLTLTYNSKPEQIQSIIDDIKSAIKAHPQTIDDYTVRFADFDSSSLNVSVVYFVRGNEGSKMNETKEQLNFQIMDIVSKNGCEFAFPTRTVYIEKQ